MCHEAGISGALVVNGRRRRSGSAGSRGRPLAGGGVEWQSLFTIEKWTREVVRRLERGNL